MYFTEVALKNGIESLDIDYSFIDSLWGGNCCYSNKKKMRKCTQ